MTFSLQLSFVILRFALKCSHLLINYKFVKLPPILFPDIFINAVTAFSWYTEIFSRTFQTPSSKANGFQLCFFSWMMELCWLYKILSHMTSEMHYWGFIRREGLSNPSLHFWHLQKQHTAFESAEGCKNTARYSPSLSW